MFFSEVYHWIVEVIASILAFVLSVLGFAGPNPAEKKETFWSMGGKEGVIAIVVDAIKENDVDTIYNLYSEAHKEEIPDLKDKIQNLINSIDGSIIKDEFHSGLGEHTYANFGIISEQYTTIGRKLYTDTGKYYWLIIGYMVTDTKNPNNVGMMKMSLDLIDEENSSLELIAQA